MPRKSPTGKATWVDPDDAPELTEAFFESATIMEGDKVIRRGRPPTPGGKRQVTLRLDADIVDRFRGSGPGWQTRINEALRESLSRHSVG
ncbi:BrnA antitoxin family protein [Asaia astilbis]|uniref:BrnA antitoxin family protein n=1 Tax=Asaia astilbis TaxID=610244 RepID=UPI000A070DEF|nr:BrnA antitoxin family protein [Asaia astilbis]